MTRIALLFLLVVAACSDGDDRAPLHVGGAIDGPWRIAWSCPGCEIGAYNPLSHTQTATVDGDRVRYDSDQCIECTAEHVGVRVGDCLRVLPGVDFGVERSAYDICPARNGSGIEADILWTGYPGPPSPRLSHLASEE